MRIVDRFEAGGERLVRFECPCGRTSCAREADVASGAVKSCGSDRASSIVPVLLARLAGGAA